MFFELLTGLKAINTLRSFSASRKSAEAYQRVGEFNAQMEERNIDLIDKALEINRRVRALDEQEARYRFSTETLGTLVNQYAGAGIDVSRGTPMAVARQFAKEFEVDQAKADFNLAVAEMQMEDAKEEARLRAELSRMEGGFQAAAARAEGTSSLIAGFTDTATFAYDNRAEMGFA